MKGDHLLDIHPVDVIGTKHRNQVGLKVVHQVEVLKDRIGSSLVPGLSQSHLGRDRDDEMIGKHSTELPSILEMLDERLRTPLDKDVDRVDAGIDEVGKNEINDSVFATERHCGLCPVSCQRMEPSTLPSRHYQCQRSHKLSVNLPE